jgi:hypothetical protein
MKRRFHMFLCFFLLSAHFVNAQEILYKQNGFGFSVGAHLAFGTHLQRMGLSFNAFYVKDIVQINGETRFYFNAKNLGPAKRYEEAVTSLGMLLGFGERSSSYNPFLNAVSNQTGHRYSVAYACNLYHNRIGTAQRTGVISLQFNRISFIIENDIFAKAILDRFRTGAFLLQYQHDSLFQAGINCSMWTGQMGKVTATDSKQIYPGCYMDTTGGVYTNYSHGLLSAQLKWHVGYSQNVQMNAGVDAERVRHVMQNKLIHDMKWMPQKLQKVKNCHIPMLDENGNAYLFKEGQKIKPAKMYLNLCSNAGVFY